MPQQSHIKKIILASTSPYRKTLLERLPIRFETARPDCDETPRAGELPTALVKRLALAKALSVAAREPGALIIGSDQVAACDDRIVGKPGSQERARAQLASFSGKTVLFHSAFAVVCPQDGLEIEQTVDTRVQFRTLAEAEIARYVAHDDPVDCAGSFRSESLGPTLLEEMVSSDPSAIMGLPLIALSNALRAAGLRLP